MRGGWHIPRITVFGGGISPGRGPQGRGSRVCSGTIGQCRWDAESERKHWRGMRQGGGQGPHHTGLWTFS